MAIEPLSYEDYERLDAVRSSELKHAFKSWRQFEYARRVGWRPKVNTLPGNITHSILELLPVERFEHLYTVMPDFARHPGNVTNGRTLKSGEVTGQKPSTSRNTKWVEDQEAAFRREHHGEHVVPQSDYNRAVRMLGAIQDNAAAMRLIEGSVKEASVTGAINGVRCKARIDGYDPKNGILWDLKTTLDISPHAFGRTAANLRYLFQMALYWRLLEANGVTIDEVYLIAVQDSAPRKDGGINDAADCCVYSVPMVAVENQMATVGRLLGEYGACQHSGEWPGVPDGELVVPNWAMGEMELVD